MKIVRNIGEQAARAQPPAAFRRLVSFSPKVHRQKCIHPYGPLQLDNLN